MVSVALVCYQKNTILVALRLRPAAQRPSSYGEKEKAWAVSHACTHAYIFTRTTQRKLGKRFFFLTVLLLLLLGRFYCISVVHRHTTRSRSGRSLVILRPPVFLTVFAASSHKAVLSQDLLVVLSARLAHKRSKQLGIVDTVILLAEDNKRRASS